MVKMRSLKHFLITYLAVLPEILKGMLNIFKPKSIQKFVHDILNMKDLQKDCHCLQSRNISEVMGPKNTDDINIKIGYNEGRKGGTHNMKEIAVLAYVCKTIDPKLIFEFGTFTGSTTRNFALNTSSDAKIITLDLPDEKTEHVVGEDFLGTLEQDKIQIISGSSKDYDFSEWHNKCDLVWVDACHDYDYVVADTENAFKIAKPGGYILWHDYRPTAWWSDVTRHLREMKDSWPDLLHIKGTTIAILRKYRG
ncbi:MAG: class I SAM-dependent methyltransferase [Candidatus Omnitrophica bacterium]|nr:class I SAM-dependent methyltransferase [Candidatus Omnitrophota bacterium]